MMGETNIQINKHVIKLQVVESVMKEIDTELICMFSFIIHLFNEHVGGCCEKALWGEYFVIRIVVKVCRGVRLLRG